MVDSLLRSRSLLGLDWGMRWDWRKQKNGEKIYSFMGERITFWNRDRKNFVRGEFVFEKGVKIKLVRLWIFFRAYFWRVCGAKNRKYIFPRDSLDMNIPPPWKIEETTILLLPPNLWQHFLPIIFWIRPLKIVYLPQ